MHTERNAACNAMRSSVFEKGVNALTATSLTLLIPHQRKCTLRCLFHARIDLNVSLLIVASHPRTFESREDVVLAFLMWERCGTCAIHEAMESEVANYLLN